MPWHTRDELLSMGLQHVGQDVQVSTGAKLYRPQHMSIGNFSRIDDGVMLTAGANGKITIGDHVHLAAYVVVESPDEAVIGDFAGLAARVTVLGGSDDYGGDFLTGPTIPASLRRQHTARISVGRHAIVGAHSVILPGGEIGEGTAVGAMSLVNRPLDPFGVYAGVPVRKIRDRARRFLDLQVSIQEAPGQ